MKNTQHISTLLLTLAGAAAVVAGLAGCQGDRGDKPPRQFFPDMDDSPKHKPQVKTDFFEDKRSMRPSVPNTVAYGRHNVSRDVLIGKPDWYATFHGQRQDLLRDEWEIYQGAVPKIDPSGVIVYDATGKVFEKVVDRIPIRVDQELLLRGEERFNIYCAACHGYEGDGKGIVGDPARTTGWVGGARNLLAAPYTDMTKLQGKDGYLYYVARQGMYDASKAQKMPGYAHALSSRDTWAVVAWLRVLQEARSVPLGELPKDQQDKLNASRPAAAATPASTPAPTPAPASAAGTPSTTGGK
jgi:mono/diheme cytochrome c family protein